MSYRQPESLRCINFFSLFFGFLCFFLFAKVVHPRSFFAILAFAFDRVSPTMPIVRGHLGVILVSFQPFYGLPLRTVPFLFLGLPSPASLDSLPVFLVRRALWFSGG